MLAPDVVVACDELAVAYSTIRQADAFAHAVRGTSIGWLTPDPDWLGQMRGELDLLRDGGAEWQLDRPDIWAPVLSQFGDYAALFTAVAETRDSLGGERELWIGVLEELRRRAAEAHNATRSAQSAFQRGMGALRHPMAVLDESLEKAWASVEGEEKEVRRLAASVGALQDRITTMGEGISAAGLSAGQTYVKNNVSISYTIISKAGADVPYLTIAAALYSTAKFPYDLISTDDELAKLLDKIRDERVRMSERAQAAGMAKAIVQMIHGFDRALAKVDRRLPNLAGLWESERAKLDGAIHALKAGADPTNVFELATLRAASPTWTKLGDFVRNLTTAPVEGSRVHIDIADDDKGAGHDPDEQQ